MITIADLWVIRRHDKPLADSDELPGAGREDVCVFTSPQALVPFPLAASIVVTVARAARTIGRTDLDSVLVPLVAALTIGAIIVLTIVVDSGARPRTARAWCSALAIAFVNSLVLFAAAVGIEKF